MILACVVAAEAAVAVMLTLPAPRAVRKQIVGLTSMLLQPFAGILPFAAFQLLGARALASPSRGFGPRFPPSRYSALTGLLFFFWPPGCADIYWKNEHRLMCTSEICTADERIRFEKSVSELRSCAPFQF